MVRHVSQNTICFGISLLSKLIKHIGKKGHIKMKQRKIMVLALIVAFLFNIHITSYTFAMETTKAPSTSNITVTNNYVGIDDIIDVTGLVQGDIVNVYSASSGGELIGSATVAEGQTSVTITKPQLGISWGYIYVSAKSVNKYESSRTKRQYYSEPKTESPYEANIKITNNYVGIDDIIEVTGLVQGDIVNVYIIHTII